MVVRNAVVERVNLGGGGAVSSVFGRTGDVTAEVGDYSAFYLNLDQTNPQTVVNGAPVFDSSIVLSSVPIGRIPYATTAGLLTSTSALTYVASGFGFDEVRAPAATLVNYIGVGVPASLTGSFFSSAGLLEANRTGLYGLQGPFKPMITYDESTGLYRLANNNVLINGSGSIYTPINQGHFFGSTTVPNASITSNAADLIFNSRVTGTGNIRFTDGNNVALGSTNGNIIGLTGDKVGFLGATAIVRQSATADLGTVLSDFGFRTAGTAYPITTSGAVVFSGTGTINGSWTFQSNNVTIRDVNISSPGSTGVSFGNTNLQKISLYGVTPVTQPSNTATIDSGVLVALGARASGGVANFATTLKPRTGGTAAGSEPMQFTSASLLTTATAGTLEFLTDKYYATITTGAARKELTLNDIALTSGRVPFVTTNGRLTDDADMTFATDTLIVTKIVGSTSVKAGSAGGFISSDNSAGITATITTAALTPVGSQGSMTFKDGILTAQTAAT